MDRWIDQIDRQTDQTERQTDRQVYQYFGICSFCVFIGDIEYNLGMGLVINTYIFIYIYIYYVYIRATPGFCPGVAA